jgi:riboflavin kinase/FMN adenylyltransferase
LTPSRPIRPITIHVGQPESSLGPAAITIGSFDGVHLGHQALLQALVTTAAELDARPVAVTFEPHPRCVLDPEHCPRRLTTLTEKAELMAEAGVTDLLVIPFDRAFSQKSPREFMAWLADALELRALVCGYDFAFGRARAGTVGWLRANGYRVVEVARVELQGRVVHSSGIRGLVGSGEVAAAAELLGREYSLRGRVIRGHQRGRELGFPTANLAVDADKAMPGPAAYAGWARGSFGRRLAAISVGHQPTFGGGDLSVEAYLLDFDGELYGQELELRFALRLHPDTRYPSVEELVEQIGRDVDDTRRLLNAQ